MSNGFSNTLVRQRCGGLPMFRLKSLSGMGDATGRFRFCLLAALLVAAFSDSPAEAIVVAQKNPNLVEGKIAIGLREELGENSVEIERILRENPKVRIGWPSEFEIGADPEWPDNFYLIDMNHPGASSTYRSWNQVGGSSEASEKEPRFVGRLDDGSFATGLDGELQKIIRRKALLAMDNPADFLKDTDICVSYADDYACSPPADPRGLKTGRPLGLEIRLSSKNERAQFVYVLMVKPDHEIEWIFRSDKDEPIAPGVVVLANFDRQPFEFEEAGVHRFLVITSEKPINETIFAFESEGRIGSSQCQSVLERILCQALTGAADPLLTQEMFLASSGSWSTSRVNYRGFELRAGYVGGGVAVPPGFAPWQVQIRSTVKYTPEQIEKDKALGRAGKFLWKQTEYQRYHRCGGSLIAPDIVLTAAHCVAKPPVDGAKVLTAREVLAGTQSLVRGGQPYRIVSVVVHQGYRPGNPRDDIAILRIAPKGRRVPPTPIRLTDSRSSLAPVDPGSLIQVLGWGFTEVVQRGERHEMTQAGPQFAEPDLRIANMAVLDPHKCRAVRGYRNVVVDKICAVTPSNRGPDGTTYSCRGDSGGPVIRQVNGKKVQVGLVAWGKGCGAVEDGQQNPSLFVDLAKYSGWIGRAIELARVTKNRSVPLR